MKYLSKDQNAQAETTTYWMQNLDGDTFGVVESNFDVDLVDCDGCPVVDNHTNKDEFFNAVTDEMRQDF